MTWCRAREFFKYSKTALEDPDFPAFKADLESAVLQYDISDDFLSYTHIVTTSLDAILSSVQLILGSNSPYFAIINITELCIAAAYGATMSISALSKRNAATAANKLFAQGAENNYFQGPPPSNLPPELADSTNNADYKEELVEKLNCKLVARKR